MSSVAAAMYDTATVGKAKETQGVSFWQDWAKAREVLGLKTDKGSIDAVAAGTVVMNAATAKSRDVKVGDTLTLQLQRGESRTYRVAGTFKNSSLANSLIVPWTDATAGFRGKLPSQAYFDLKDGAEASTVRPRIEKLLAGSPEVELKTKSEVSEVFSGGFAMMLTVVQALLGGRC